MANVLFTNVRIFDASGTQPFAGDVLVQGNRISRVSSGVRSLPTAGVTVVEGQGATLMPGMVEAHTHFAWNDQPSLSAIQRMPPEEHILWCAHVAKRYLDMGWTSCVGAATAKPRLDVVIRDAIASGQIPGPRYLAASQEITVLGGLGDETLPHLPYPEFSFGAIVSGREEMRKTVRMFLKYGVDTIKLNLSGEYIAGLPAEFTPMTDEEVAIAAAETKMRGKRLAAHARSAESVKQCVRHGIELVFHASFIDAEGLDMLEAAKDRHFVAPGLAWLVNTSFHASKWGLMPDAMKAMGYHRELEVAVESLKKMMKRGIRILPGGDYGFAWTEHGTNARDLEYFVKYLGMSPMEALLSATKFGGQVMMRGHELGQVREGFLADLLLVDGDPLADIRILQDRARILAVMKDGEFHRAPPRVDRGNQRAWRARPPSPEADMTGTLFTNVRILDGTGREPFAGEVLMRGNRIERVAPGNRVVAREGCTVLDGAGATLMPGLVEAHTHFAWNDAETLQDIQRMPTEEHTLWTAGVAKVYLDHGFTSCVGAATAKPRLDVVVRNAINEGLIPGPRYLAASQEITVAGGLGDETLPHIPWPEFSFGVNVSGPEEMRRAVRLFLKYGVDSIKLNLSGDNLTPHADAHTTWMSDEEVAVACREAHIRGKRVAAHARSAASVKQCVRHGIEVIYHASYTDEEALDLLESVKDRVFVAPGLSVIVKLLSEGAAYGIPPERARAMGYQRELDAACESLRAMKKRGIRVLPGGDYGFAWAPHGTNAMDLEYFVKYLGFTPMEAIVSATRLGGEIMMKPNELGLVREGALADLLLVDGDPLANLAILRDRARLLAIVKDGRFHKAPEVAAHGVGLAVPA